MRHKHTILFLTVVFFVGCTATLPVNYAPSNLTQGSGSIAVNQFVYAAARDGKLPPNQPEEHGIGTILLSQDIATLFSDAVRKELRFSGYDLSTSASVTIGGIIDRFSYDWVGFSTQSVDVSVVFQVHRAGKEVYLRKITSHKEMPKAPGYETEAIKSAISDCIQQFLADTHTKHIL